MNNETDNNPLGLENKKYTVTEFASAIRAKFNVNDSLPDIMLVNVFIDKYPMYGCKIKETKNTGSCSCC